MLENVTPSLLLANFPKGKRVQMHPATDAWMQGDRHGEVVRTGKFYVHVKMDLSGKIRKVAPENLM